MAPVRVGVIGGGIAGAGARGTDAVMIVSHNAHAGAEIGGGLYYCGAYTTPGNGHDLSLLSGLVVANAIGAPYPFSNDSGAHSDIAHLRRMMLGG